VDKFPTNAEDDWDLQKKKKKLKAKGIYAYLLSYVVFGGDPNNF
jgi:hypothetical protein